VYRLLIFVIVKFDDEVHYLLHHFVIEVGLLNASHTQSELATGLMAMEMANVTRRSHRIQTTLSLEAALGLQVELH
jgi:Trp operon repressor